MSRNRYIGWVIGCSDRQSKKDRIVGKAATEAQARELVRRLNEAAVRNSGAHAALFWCEWWSTSSQVEREEVVLNTIATVEG